MSPATLIAALLPIAALQAAQRGAAEKPAIDIAIESRSLQPGELVVVTLSFTTQPSNVRVSAFGKTVSSFNVGPLQRRALIGIDLDQRPGTYQLVVDARSGSHALHEAQPLVVQAKKFATRTLRVSPDFVNPPASLTERIAREARMVGAAFAHSAPERLWTAPFQRPVPDPASGGFGQRSVFNGAPRNPHSGTDFASAAGTPIHAPNAGRVVLADDLFFTGGTVMIDHGLGLVSLFAHLSKRDVQQGDVVTAGQIIGEVGATGRVTGPHLHWAMRASGARIDPLSALALLGEPK